MPEAPPEKIEPQVVHTLWTDTAIYASPEGEKFPYVMLRCRTERGDHIALLFNPPMTVMLLDAVSKFMGTVFGVDEVGQNMALMTDQPIDWDNLPPPPEDVVDFDPDQEPDPDYRHDDQGD